MLAIHDLPKIGADDPQLAAALRPATFSGDGIGNVRLLLLVVILNASGLLLLFGLALRRR